MHWRLYFWSNDKPYLFTSSLRVTRSLQNPHLCARFKKALILLAWPADTNMPHVWRKYTDRHCWNQQNYVPTQYTGILSFTLSNCYRYYVFGFNFYWYRITNFVLMVPLRSNSLNWLKYLWRSNRTSASFHAYSLTVSSCTMVLASFPRWSPGSLLSFG